MKCSPRSFVIFLEVSVSRAMSCFIGCFRDGDDDDEDGHRRRPLHFRCSEEAVVTPKDHCRNKSVRFECDSGSKSSPDSKNSPFPTPMKLSEEMQTPGTDFVKKTRIRSQVVYDVSNPVEVVSSNSDHLLSETLAWKEAMFDADVGKLILFDEDEEDDTALSQFRPSVRCA